MSLRIDSLLAEQGRMRQLTVSPVELEEEEKEEVVDGAAYSL